MRKYQRAALNRARARALELLPERMAYLDAVCGRREAADALIARMLQRPVTLNFHPDRLCAQGCTVIEGLAEQGRYLSQYSTGTTNGSRSARVGGARHAWEQQLFGGAYPDAALDRPKYGALNALNYLDGASMRFGSCYIELKAQALERCTFCYGDSSDEPEALCTADAFGCVAAALMRDVERHKRLLNQCVSTAQEALAMLMRAQSGPGRLGRNLDFCIEAHVHGEVSLARDVAALCLDGSYRDAPLRAQAEALCARNGIALRWIPERRVRAAEVDGLFRGPGIVKLARRVDELCGGSGWISARELGEAARDSARCAERWRDIGGPDELFQYFKQLWHYVGYFG